MIYTCTWSTGKAEGTIEVDGRTKKEAREKARKLLRKGYGLKARIVEAEKLRRKPIRN